MADSGRMFTILNDQYLKLELFNGHDYSEGTADQNVGAGGSQETLQKTKFSKTEIVFDLSSFDMARTDKKWFQGNRIMRNITELDHDMDSMNNERTGSRLVAYRSKENMFSFHAKGDSLVFPPELKAYQKRKDSIEQITNPGASHMRPTLGFKLVSLADIDKKTKRISDSLFWKQETLEELGVALNQTRMLKSQLLNMNANRENYWHEYKVFQIQWHKILSNSIACLVMFLIGAPLGAIIKKGGLGVPVIVSIFFFIAFYLITSTGEKWTEQDIVSAPVGIWAADFILATIGLFFLRQARVDARLFDADFYNVVWDKLKTRFGRKQISTPNPA
ncbi:MAG: LptF/LptG family permease [Cyclobacteriaceae bacterium]|nr:LptF/LptG family permease [Cyclobacteriaceae bacterium]